MSQLAFVTLAGRDAYLALYSHEGVFLSSETVATRHAGVYHRAHPNLTWIVRARDRSFCEGCPRVFCFDTLWHAFCVRARNRYPAAVLTMYHRAMRWPEFDPTSHVHATLLAARLFFHVMGGSSCLFFSPN